MTEAIEERASLTFPALIPLGVARSYLGCSHRGLRAFANRHAVEVVQVGREKYIPAPELARAMRAATKTGLGR